MEAFSKYLLLYCFVCLWASAEFEVTSSNPLQTEGPETNYVENVSDNEHCFYNPDEEIYQLPCPEGRRRARERGESSCLPCPFEVGGLQTFQPEQNDCDKCILCSECGEGEEVLSNCSRTKDTKCQPIAHQVGSSTTGEISKADVTTLPTEHTTMETIPKNRGTPTGRPGVGMSNIEPNRWESRFWWMTGAACILFVTLVCISLFLLWTHRRSIPSLPTDNGTSNGGSGDGVQNGATSATDNRTSNGGSGDGVQNGATTATDNRTSNGGSRDRVQNGATTATDNQTSNGGSGDGVQNGATTVNENPPNSDESGEATENDFLLRASVAIHVDTAGAATNQETIPLKKLDKRRDEFASDNGGEVDSTTNTRRDPVEKGTEEESKMLA